MSISFSVSHRDASWIQFVSLNPLSKVLKYSIISIAFKACSNKVQGKVNHVILRETQAV